MKFNSKTQTAIEDVIKTAGIRVKTERKNQRLSRRELSEKSGVSPRYLVQLESGTGNISIGLLKSVALALDLPMGSLLDETSSSSAHDDRDKVMRLYDKADHATRSRILNILDPEGAHHHKAARVCLLGLRGAGKSTLGTMLSQQFNITFMELNTLIEEKAGMPTAEIVALYGQEGYRTFEAEALENVITSHENIILAAAGGIVSNQDTFERLLSTFHTVWVKALPEEHMERVRAQGDHRPMEGRPEAMLQLKHILESREQHYRQAQYILNTAKKTEKDCLDELAYLLTSNHIISETS